MSGIVCIGELLIDFVSQNTGNSIADTNSFIKKAGGAPANVAACIGKLGGNSLFIGKVGKDPFGEFLSNTLKSCHVNTDGLIHDPHLSTTLAFVSLMKNGERDFIFSRGADEKLRWEEINVESLLSYPIFHFGSATAMLGGELYNTYTKLFTLAIEEGKIISFDPNFRSDLWKNDIPSFIKRSEFFIENSNLVKVSEEELYILTRESSLEKGCEKIHSLGTPLVLVTLGPKGTFLSTPDKNQIVTSIKVSAIDSTGAGDAFIGALLYQLAQANNPANLLKSFDSLKNLVSFANKVGALTCTKYGAIDALPERDDLLKI